MSKRLVTIVVAAIAAVGLSAAPAQAKAWEWGGNSVGVDAWEWGGNVVAPDAWEWGGNASTTKAWEWGGN